MITKSQARRKQDIKTKLMAAIAMLLVSSIMMVSSTYAWFTLSTAPEVTGITTQVGANGNLEMALLPTNGLTTNASDFGITSGSQDGTKDWSQRNLTWGNLVDLSNNEVYGLDKITLYPAELNRNSNDTTKIDSGSYLKTPAYGADGRVSELLTDTVTGTYELVDGIKVFPNSENTGVRAIGNASAMTPRQLAYRSARSAASSSRAAATRAVELSLNENGNGLADIAIAYAMTENPVFDEGDKAVIEKMITGLNTAVEHIENAYKQNIIAWAASAGSQESVPDAVFPTVQSTIDAANIYDLAENGITVGDETVHLPENIKAYINELKATKGQITTASSNLTTLGESGIIFEDLRKALDPLANISKMSINGTSLEGDLNMGTLASKVISDGGVIITITNGGGVYSDIADHCGAYKAMFKYTGKIGSLDVENFPVTMDVVGEATAYLTTVETAVATAGAPVTGTVGNANITDFYGYVIDLGFRTNAASSKLLLQTQGIDRIYKDSGGAEITSGEGENQVTETTMGNGSTMTFETLDTSFSVDQMKELMKAIRVVFFDTEEYTVLGTAMLDVTNASLEGVKVTANLYLYEATADGYIITDYDSTATGVTYYTKTTTETFVETTDTVPVAGTTYYTDAAGETEFSGDTFTAGNTYYVKVTEDTYTEAADPANAAAGTLYTKTEYNKLTGDDAAITDLTQGVAKAVSVLVYLDGNSVDNADVSATGTTSMSGKLNLQFSSSAELKPMNYTPLMEQGGGSGNGGSTATTYTVGCTGVVGEDTVAAGSDYTFTIATGYKAPVTVKVGNITLTEGTDYDVSGDTYTIPANKINGNMTITATPTD